MVELPILGGFLTRTHPLRGPDSGLPPGAPGMEEVKRGGRTPKGAKAAGRLGKARPRTDAALESFLERMERRFLDRIPAAGVSGGIGDDHLERAGARAAMLAKAIAVDPRMARISVPPAAIGRPVVPAAREARGLDRGRQEPGQRARGTPRALPPRPAPDAARPNSANCPRSRRGWPRPGASSSAKRPT